MVVPDFITIDFETANSYFDSACAVGIAVVTDGIISETFYSLIKPECEFDPQNVAIHGITSTKVENAPFFCDVWGKISKYFGKCVVFAHNAFFDMSVLHESHPWLSDIPDFKFVDTISLCKEFVPGKKDLAHCADYFGIDMGCHHNAMDDAVTCAKIVLMCLDKSGAKNIGALCFSMPNVKIHSFSEVKTRDRAIFHNRVSRIPEHISPASIPCTVSCIDSKNPLYGKNVVFTGELSIDRKEAMQLAINAGASVKTSVSKKTDYLVVSIQDKALVGDDGISTKEEKAYELKKSGSCNIEIIDECTFMGLLKNGQRS